jgi:CBS domain-containing protein
LDLDQVTPTVHARRVPRREELAMKELVASDVMNTQVLAVRPDMTVRELATLLTENEISGAPVTDGHGRLLGMVSLSDIAQGEADEVGLAPSESDPEATVHGWEDEATSDEMRELHVEGGEALVRDIMTPTAYTVPDDTPVSRLARTMVAGRVHRLLVVRDQRVVGIVTSLDLLTLLSGDVKSRRRASRGVGPAAAKPRRRRSVATPPPSRRPHARG